MEVPLYQKEWPMLQKMEPSASVQGDPRYPLGGTPAETVTSESVIPAVPGEFYAYSPTFTVDRPAFVLMKCKANKSRPIVDAPALGREINLVFRFENPVQVCSVRTANALGLLGTSVDNALFGETWIAPAGINAEKFYELRSQKDEQTLVDLCRTACSKPEESITLHPGALIAMMTDGEKYGMFLVTDVGPDSIRIDACHILLP